MTLTQFTTIYKDSAIPAYTHHAPQPHNLSYLHCLRVYCAIVPVWNLEPILVHSMAAKGLTQHTKTAAHERLGSAPL